MKNPPAPDAWIEPGTFLEGNRIRLEPVEKRHLDALWEAAKFPEIWAWNPSPILSRDQMAERIQFLLAQRAQGRMFSFAILEKESGQYAGSSSYLALEPAHRRLEIGFTWLSPRWQRTHVNTGAKFLLMRYAFEQLGCIRVEFKTDALNAKSRAALKRIGAVEEGTLRQHMVCHDGRLRDSVYFSVLDSEWPGVKTNLLGKMNRPA